MDGLSAALQSNRCLGMSKEFTIDCTSFKLYGGKGKSDSFQETRHPRTRVLQHSKNMVDWLKSKYGLFDTDRVKSRLSQTGAYDNACFVIALATAIVFPEKKKLQAFKR
jgi:hypothetical protein